ncbi:DUF4238 domain-containing protein [Bradyrhizobium sp. STM 3809]|uniref:DUF4238 domain-containing protein n=1 Tax=Bradyrhizobium sp. STM 3809 TaxID=551936 RepID=UPI00024075EA|nr:DUF4238 domain-containing protein [Bradyrhizobium sp. STM 3809]CCD97732.1 hypothetical protein BRAS3809_1290002 [Bradyrhizobium sp. STM 3809]
MSAENQHWVPKLLLKNFVDAGRVYCFDIHSGEVTKPPPKFAACEPGFNDFEIDGKRVSFEDKFEKIETKAAPILKRILAERSLAGLSAPDRRHVARFVAAQSFRTKAFYEGLADKPSRSDYGTIFNYLWHSLFVVAQDIARRHWALMVIEGDDAFYLGDNPVVLQRTCEPNNGKNLGFDVVGVEAFLPLSPVCALYIACSTISRMIIDTYEQAMAVHRIARAKIFSGGGIGLADLLETQATLRRAGPIYKAFTEGAPLVATPENIDNLNYLQCSWALNKVHSNRKDFAFARKVFRQTPQYRETVRTSVLEKGRILLPPDDSED